MKVKICGITRIEDAVAAVKAGADYIGFVFAKSPRKVDHHKAVEICRALEDAGLRDRTTTAGVFVNEDPGKMNSYISDGIIDIVQVHGDESAEECAGFDFPYIRAIRVSDLSVPGGAAKLEQDARVLTCRIVIIDSFSEKVYGGSGIRVNISSAAVAGRILHAAGKDFFIAGGINPENALETASATGADGIDVSGGVEESPGIKSADKITSLIKSLREGAI